MQKKKVSPGIQIFLLIFLIVVAMIFVTVILFFMIRPLFGNFDPEEIKIIDSTSAYLSAFLTQLSLFLVAYLFFLRVLKLKTSFEISFRKWKLKTVGIVLLLLVLGIFISEGLSLVNQFIIEQFPESGFLEQQAEQIERYKLWFNSDKTNLFPLAIIIFALIPAIVEELIFRGLLLKKLLAVSMGNTHFAVVVSSLFFAAVHMQPWNLLPMIAMGILLGYVYVYFKDIRYSMLIHFLYNGLQLTAAFFFAT